MGYEITNLTYSPIRIILEDDSEVTIGARESEYGNVIQVNKITDQIKTLSDKSFLRIKYL